MRKLAWWHPAELERAERQVREGESTVAGDSSNDFVSYRQMLQGLDPDAAQIGTHNDLDPAGKIDSILRRIDLGDPKHILDAGCGLGFTTKALAKAFPRAKVTGIDISHDAIEFASSRFSTPSFKVHLVAPDEAPVGSFDTIFCFEFYPYTRSRDVAFQAQITEWFASQLRPGGKIVVYQTWKNRDSLSAVLDEVATACPDLSFVIVKTHHPKLPQAIPEPLKLLGSFLIGLTGREGIRRVIVVGRSGE